MIRPGARSNVRGPNGVDKPSVGEWLTLDRVADRLQRFAGGTTAGMVVFGS
jgi:hypothetical protein